MLDAAMREWGGQTDLWVFGYASLIWRPEFVATEQRAASVHGWHRALQMSSRINRGTPENPGLVFALVPGGSCRGMVYRIDAGLGVAPQAWATRAMANNILRNDSAWFSSRVLN